MLYLVFTLDVWLLDFFQEQSHRFQRLTGKDNFYLAWCLFAIYTAHVNYFNVATTIEFLQRHSSKDAVLIVTLTWFIIFAIFLFEFRFLRVLVFIGKVLSRGLFLNILRISPLAIILRLWSIATVAASLVYDFAGTETLSIHVFLHQYLYGLHNAPAAAEEQDW
jgi:hypothetical protein